MLKKIDESLFLILNGNHQTILDYLMILASNILSYIPMFVLCSIIIIKHLKGNDIHYHTFLNISLVLVFLVMQYFLCRYLLNDVFKAFITRERPCLNPNISSFVRMLDNDCKSTLQPYFSYKTCLIFCLSSFLFFTVKEGFKVFKILLVIWSLLVAYSRIYVGDHYPLSVLISTLIGIASGYLVYRFYHYLKYNLLVI
jgi:undecaprenyl-diphosphatase